MLSSADTSTITLPPPCHPPTGETKMQYTAESHKNDVELRAAFLPQKAVVITPAVAPPLVWKALRWYESKVKQKAVAEAATSDSNLKSPVSLNESSLNMQSKSPLVDSNMPAQKIERVKRRRKFRKPSSKRTLNLPLLVSIPRSLITSFPSMNISIPLDCVSVVGNQTTSSESIPQVHSTPISETKSLTPEVKTKEISKPSLQLDQHLPMLTPVSQRQRESSVLQGPTPNNTFGFRLNQSDFLPASCDTHEVQYVTTMSLELHVRTRGKLKPDPEWDPILAAFYHVHNDWPSRDGNHDNDDNNYPLGIIAIDIAKCGFTGARQSPNKKASDGAQSHGANSARFSPKKGRRSPSKAPPLTLPATDDTTGVGGGGSGADAISGSVSSYLHHCGLSAEEEVAVTYVATETELLVELVRVVRVVDPDFLSGWEVSMLSWGYLVDRAATLNVNMTNELSRTPGQ